MATFPRIGTTPHPSGRQVGRPLRARGCKCEQPLANEDTCLLCGHDLPGLEHPLHVGWAGEDQVVRQWTLAGVVRAFIAFEHFNGRLPFEEEWEHETNEHPSAFTVRRFYGDWRGAVAAVRATQRRRVEPSTRLLKAA